MNEFWLVRVFFFYNFKKNFFSSLRSSLFPKEEMCSFSKPLPPQSISNFLSDFQEFSLSLVLHFSFFLCFCLTLCGSSYFYLSIWNFLLAITAWFPQGRVDKNKTLDTDHEGPILLCMGHMVILWYLSLPRIWTQHRRELEMQVVEPSNANQRQTTAWDRANWYTAGMSATVWAAEVEEVGSCREDIRISFQETGFTEACRPLMAVAGITNWLLYCHLLFSWQPGIGPQNLPPHLLVQLELGSKRPE